MGSPAGDAVTDAVGVVGTDAEVMMEIEIEMVMLFEAIATALTLQVVRRCARTPFLLSVSVSLTAAMAVAMAMALTAIATVSVSATASVGVSVSVSAERFSRPRLSPSSRS